MPNELPLPDELQHLIEKRENDGRRESNRRVADDGRNADQRGGNDRRQTKRRSDADRFRPGDTPGLTGRFRCEHCLSCINIAKPNDRLPNCTGCGNRSDLLYAIVAE